MVKEGYYFGLPPLALGAAALFLRWTFAGVILLCLAAFIFYFFRDPERVIPADPGAIVSPADGRVVIVTDEENDGHPGKRVYGKARHRDPVRSSHSYTAWRWGHKWVVLAILVQFPFPQRAGPCRCW